MAKRTEFNFDTAPDSAYARLPQVLQVVPTSGASAWRWVKNGTFPKPVKLSARVTAWRVGDIRQWMAAQAGAAQ